MSPFFRPWILLLVLATLSACSTNPVTGKRELVLMPLSQQIAMGQKNYGPYQQQQGGRYVVDPNVNAYVSRVGQKLARVADLDLPYEFVVLNQGGANAWALPGGKIAINRGLLEILEDEAQLAAVLGHEIVHAAAGHTAQQMTRGTFLGLGATVISALGQTTEYGGLINTGAQFGAGAWNARYGRHAELESDRVGIKYMKAVGYNPQAAVELQEKFVELSQGRPSDVLSNLFASHPPSQLRVDKNRELAAGSSGTRNREAYQRATAQLRRDAAAYKAEAEAAKAAKAGNYTEAERHIAKAIREQPNEANFYITKGQIQMAQKQNKSAQSSFKQATRKNPEYFLSHLYHGLVSTDLKQSSAAKPSLEKSMSLLPTPIAGYRLGEIELTSGNKQKAAQYFQFAAQDKGEVGKAAQQRLGQLGVAPTQ